MSELKCTCWWVNPVHHHHHHHHHQQQQQQHHHHHHSSYIYHYCSTWLLTRISSQEATFHQFGLATTRVDYNFICCTGIHSREMLLKESIWRNMATKNFPKLQTSNVSVLMPVEEATTRGFFVAKRRSVPRSRRITSTGEIMEKSVGQRCEVDSSRWDPDSGRYLQMSGRLPISSTHNVFPWFLVEDTFWHQVTVDQNDDHRNPGSQPKPEWEKWFQEANPSTLAVLVTSHKMTCQNQQNSAV